MTFRFAFDHVDDAFVQTNSDLNCFNGFILFHELFYMYIELCSDISFKFVYN